MNVSTKGILITLSGCLSLGTARAGDDALGELLKRYKGAEVSPKAAKASPSAKPKAAKLNMTKKSVVKGAELARSPASEPKVAAEPQSSKTESEAETASGGLFGDWAGHKTKLKESGAAIDVGYKADLVRNFSGGVAQSGGLLGQLDLKGEFDFEKIANLKGLSLRLYGLGNHGSQPTDYVGDTGGTSNIQAPSTFKLYEAYLRETLDTRFVFSLGLTDLNSIYYVTDSAGAFRHSSFGIGPSLAQTGPNGPSIFPNTALAFNAGYKTESGFYLQDGVFNAIAGKLDHPYGTQVTWKPTAGYLLIWELGRAGATDDIPYKFALGAWTYTERQAALDSSKEDSYNWGSYALVNHKLADRTAGFLRYGLSSLRVNQVSQSLEAGATYQGLVGARPDDLVGLGAALAAASADAKSDGSSSCETAIEAFYRAEMGHGIALTPDLQYVIRPSFDPALANAFVGSLRVEIGF